MCLDVTALTTAVVLKLALGGIESIAQCDIHVLVRFTVYYQFLARHRDIETNVKGPPLMFVFVRNLNHYAAAHDVRIKRLKLFRLLADVAFQCFRMGNVACSDLEYEFHNYFL